MKCLEKDGLHPDHRIKYCEYLAELIGIDSIPILIENVDTTPLLVLNNEEMYPVKLIIKKFGEHLMTYAIDYISKKGKLHGGEKDIRKTMILESLCLEELGAPYSPESYAPTIKSREALVDYIEKVWLVKYPKKRTKKIKDFLDSQRRTLKHLNKKSNKVK